MLLKRFLKSVACTSLYNIFLLFLRALLSSLLSLLTHTKVPGERLNQFVISPETLSFLYIAWEREAVLYIYIGMRRREKWERGRKSVCGVAAAGTQNIKLNILKFDLRERRKRLRSVWANVLLMRIGSVAAAAAAHARARGRGGWKQKICYMCQRKAARGVPEERRRTGDIRKK